MTWDTGSVAATAVMMVVLITTAPTREIHAKMPNVTTGCVQRFDSTADCFPDEAVLEDAVTFSVEYRKSYKVITVKDASPGGPAERYVLVQCGTPVPKLTNDLVGAQVVTVPVSSLFAFSTTQLPPLVDLDRLEFESLHQFHLRWFRPQEIPSEETGEVFRGECQCECHWAVKIRKRP